MEHSDADLLQAGLGCSPLFARLLVARGFSDAAQVERFLSPSLERDWLDPFLIPGMDGGVTRLRAALRAREHIAVFGDYDLDGISATALMTRGLRALGAARVTPLLPHRSEGGYGLSEQALEKIRICRPDLLITVDNGITAAGPVASLRAAGIDVIITDHHTPEPADLPQDAVLINPQLDPAYGVGTQIPQVEAPSQLSGAGVALKVIQACGISEGRPAEWKELTDLAMMGTIADLMPVLGENRALVADGLAQLRERPNQGLRALAASVRNLDLATIASERISFSLAPRLNAAGRMGSPQAALDLLLCEDPQNCAAFAEQLALLNLERQETEAALSEIVAAQVRATFRPGQRVIVAAGAGWHEGVRGIVAARLVDTFQAVAVVCGIEDGVAYGSVRSVGSVNAYEALAACSARLKQFGGHAGAAGLTLAADKIDAFRADLEAYLDRLPAAQFEPAALVDLDCRLAELDWNLAEEFETLEPFGESMRKPVLSAAPVDVERAGLVGRDGTHLQFRARQGDAVKKAIYFRAPQPERWVGQVTPARVAFTLEKDEFRGARGVQLNVVELDGFGEEGTVSSKQGCDTAVASALGARVDTDEFVAELFAHAEASFARRDYANITDAASFYTKLAGVSFEGRQGVIAQLLPADPLVLRREPDNSYDPNAIAVVSSRLGAQIGFLNRALSAELAPILDEGVCYTVALEQVTGGEEGRSRGVNVLLTREDARQEAALSAREQLAVLERLAALSPAELDEELRRLFIGDGRLHEAQAQTLDALARDINTLTVMATGRGKSLIFHLHAARLALTQRKQSIFVFPLRALVADQAFHLEEVFAKVGLRAQVITGESSEAAREAAFEGLRAHAIDIVLTTPEFLQFHAREFAANADLGFIVIDEAHHIGQARAGNRPAYVKLGEAIRQLGNPTTLAVTATAGSEVAARICAILGIKHRVLDPTVRENLRLTDVRGGRDEAAKRGVKLPFLTGESYSKENYVLRLAQKGEKMVIYVNSRQKSVELARTIRAALPEYAWQTAFYNAGLPRETRHEIESRFRDGKLTIIIATSAFGEGVNIPDIRDVVLYHFPYNDVEFNQMAGRGGRDGKPATIHLLFTEKDARINDFILATAAPPRDSLAALYVALRDVAAGEGENFQITNADLAEIANDRLRAAGAFKKAGSGGVSGGPPPQGPGPATDLSSGASSPKPDPASASAPAADPAAQEKKPLLALTEESVSTGVSVFRELGFVRTEGHGPARRITFVPSPYKLDLTQSVRYVEGLDQLDDFQEFKEWMLATSAEELLARFNRPILPQ
ncbi:MAG: single-stranded-DNA-specific exonuclease RecJ [Actinomycetia bacterium]|nr:single-stranded-DNA-specific exonuclease RecJ [Actinomycetes bacterium]